MRFGIRLKTLWDMRRGVFACAILALLMALWSVDRVSLFPPELKPRPLQMATASTQVLVDTPRSALLDPRRDDYLESLTNRAVLLGNVMAIGKVRASVEHRAHIPADTLQVTPPLTPKQPRALAVAGSERHVGDITTLNGQYRLDIEANPTVPVLYVYSQAPTARTAEALATAAVEAMRGYLAGLAESLDTPEGEQIRLVQTGRARGKIVNVGINWQVAFLTFVLTLALSCATLIFISRVREGWRLVSPSGWATRRG